jgi:hypothetical protein
MSKQYVEKPNVLTLWFNKEKVFKTTGKKFPANFCMNEGLTIEQYQIYQNIQQGGGFRAFPVYKKGTNELICIKLEPVTKEYMDDVVARRKKYLEWKNNNPKAAAVEESSLVQDIKQHRSEDIDINF